MKMVFFHLLNYGVHSSNKDLICLLWVARFGASAFAQDLV